MCIKYDSEGNPSYYRGKYEEYEAREAALAKAFVQHLGEQGMPPSLHPLYGMDTSKLEQICGINISTRARELLKAEETVKALEKLSFSAKTFSTRSKIVSENIPKEVIEQARDSLDALLYWAEDSEDIPKEIYDEAEKILKELEKYVPFSPRYKDAAW